MRLRFALTLVSVVAVAQDKPDSGINSGNYNIHQTVEFGGRATSIGGNGALYNTFVNLNPGPRLNEQTFDMQSLDHHGLLFDNLSISSFGYGGDPNDVTRLRIYKNKWYNFSGLFRRDRNLWDYNLLANPLNPPTSNPFVPATSSLHAFQTTRRMTDLNLILLPQSRVRVRLGYTRNVSDGPSLSTYHGAQDTVLFQDWKTTLNSYRVGFDFKVLPRTSFSYDQFLHYYKGDTSWKDNTFVGYSLSTGQPIDIGVVFNTVAGTPCASPLTNITACSYYTSYTRSGPIRNGYPTEQLTFQSKYFEKVDFSGRAIYTNSQSVVSTLNEVFQGLVVKSGQRSFTDSGPAAAERVSFSGDLAGTWHVNDKLRVSDSYRYSVFRIPGHWYGQEVATFGTPTTHVSGSGADATTELFSNFLGQSFSQNDIDFDYDFNKRLSAQIGYRYNRRVIDVSDVELLTVTYLSPLPARGSCAGQTIPASGSCTFSSIPVNDASETIINQNTGVFGIAARPVDALRLNYDMEIMTADDVFTRVSPRHLLHYRLRGRYQPTPWMNLSASVNILENRNNTVEEGNLQHNRSYAFNAVIAKSQKWGTDFGYQYNDVFSRTNICFTSTPSIAGSTVCPVLSALVTGLSFYNSTTNYGYFNVMVKPASRVTATVGYNVTGVSGSTLIINPVSPLGSLTSTFHRPMASLAVELSKGLTWKTGWGYFDYNEPTGQAADSTGVSRRFRGNIVNLSLRYAF
jgi:hypothetical protein